MKKNETTVEIAQKELAPNNSFKRILSKFSMLMAVLYFFFNKITT